MRIDVSAIDFCAHPEQLDSILDLMVESFREAYRQFDPKRDLRIKNLETFLRALKSHEHEVALERPSEIEVLVAAVDGELAGAVILDRHEDGVLYIRQIATLPQFRRRGVASGLVEALKKQSDGRDVRLVTRRINTASQSLFRSMGFEIDEQWSHPDYTPEVYLAMCAQ